MGERASVRHEDTGDVVQPVVGIVMGLVVIVTMACYLIWAVTERGKLRAAGRLT